MNIVTKIKDNCIALLLLTIIAIPAFIQFSHQLEEEHEFIVCHEQEDHIHEVNIHCDLCTYHFTNYFYEFPSYPELDVPPIISETILEQVTHLCYYFPLTNKQLRAPPSFS